LFPHVSMYADATIKRGVNQFFVLRNISQDISSKETNNTKKRLNNYIHAAHGKFNHYN